MDGYIQENNKGGNKGEKEYGKMEEVKKEMVGEGW